MSLARRLAAGVAGLFVLATMTTFAPSSRPPAAGAQARPGSTVAAATGPFRAAPVPVPARGALIGAWVKPDHLTQPGRTAAIRTFEQRIGRPLDIVHSYRRLHEQIGTASDLAFLADGRTLMISWTGADSLEILAGAHDEAIRTDARQVKALRAPVLLRLRWEMDRPNLAASVHSPADYQAAWRYVRDLFAREGATNISWVWCPTASGFAQGRAGAYYPGDEVVDWTCVDVYAGSELKPMAQLLQPFLAWAAERPLPIMIGEYGVARAYSSKKRAGWLREATEVFIANPQIKAVVLFDSNPDDRTEEGEFKISDDPAAFEAFTDLARHPWFNPDR